MALIEFRSALALSCRIQEIIQINVKSPALFKSKTIVNLNIINICCLLNACLLDGRDVFENDEVDGTKAEGVCVCFCALASSYRFYFAFACLLVTWTPVKTAFSSSGDCSIASRMLCWSPRIAA